MNDPYREWSFHDRLDARHDPEQQENCRRYDEDSESSERAYSEYRNGREFRDPQPDNRFS